MLNPRGYKTCPICAEKIRKAAKVCPFCGTVLTDGPLQQIVSIRTPRPQPVAPVPQEMIEEIRTTILTEYRDRALELSDRCWLQIEQMISRAENEYRDTTVLFVNVCGFTGLVGHVPAEQIKAHLQRLYELCAHRIALHNGVIVRFVGNALLAVFGAPVAGERDAESAARATLEFREGANLLPPLGGRRIQIQAGLDTGTVTSTVVRALHAADFGISGEPIAVAQRLQAQAEPDEVLASAATYEQVKHLFEAISVGALTLKDVAEPVEVFRILRLRDRTHVQREFGTPFFGRECELAQLRERIDRAAAGEGPQFLAVHGEPGIGKTRVVWEAIRPFPPRVQFLSADCEPHGAGIPFHAVIELLRRLFDLPAAASSAEIARHIEEYFTKDALLESDQVSYLYYLFLLQSGIEKLAQVPAASLRRSIIAALMTLFRRLLARGPLVIFLDDVPWIDSSSVEFLTTLTQAEGLAGLLVVLAYRDGYRLPDDLDRRFAKMAVGPLPHRDRLGLLGWLVNQEPLGTEIRDALLVKSGGNPLFLEETARSILKLWQQADARQAPLPTARIREVIPDSLRGIIQTRMDALDDRTRRVLQCGAVLGRQFALGTIGLFEMIREGLRDRLYLLKGFQFLYDRPSANGLEFIFYHGVTQEVAYQSLPDEQKRQLHRLVAEQLEKRFAEIGALDPNCSVLAYHYQRSGNCEKALEWVMQAARHAAQMFANDEAMDLNEEAMALLMETEQTEMHRRLMADVLRQRGRLLRFSGQLDEADESFRSLLAIAEDLGDDHLRADAWAEMGMTLYQRARHDESNDFLQRAASVYERENDRAGRAMACNALGMNRLAAGDLDTALEWFERAEALGIETDWPAIAADIYNNRGLVFWRRQEYEPALESIQKAQTVWHRIHNDFGLCATALNAGILEENLGRLGSALQNYESSLRLASRLLYREAETTAMINMGNALRRRRELSRASETNSKAAELARALGRKDLEAAALENLGLDALAALRFDQARAYFRHGLETVGADGDPERRASVLLGLSKTETVLGETDPAREHLEAAKTLVEKSGCVALRSALYLAEAVLASHQNRANADALFQQAIETARQAGNLWDEMESLRAWIAHSEKKNDVDQLSRLFARLSEIMARLDQEGTEKKGRYRTGGECK